MVISETGDAQAQLPPREGGVKGCEGDEDSFSQLNLPLSLLASHKNRAAPPRFVYSPA